MTVTITAFYKFVAVADGAALRAHLADVCARNAIKGTILVAPEGINATVSGSAQGVAALLADVRSDPRFADLVSKEATFDRDPFKRMKVKLKREILTFGHPEADPTRRVGTYVKPADWNALISDPDVVVLDTRNDYEYAIGTFERAADPATRAFTEFPDYVMRNLDPTRHKKIAMFCTGGIRCEKASAYMLALGYPEVYHLEGGILKYLETVPADESLWRGQCFVFDERVSVGHGLAPGGYVICKGCGWPIPRSPAGPGSSGAGTTSAGACPRCAAETSC